MSKDNFFLGGYRKVVSYKGRSGGGGFELKYRNKNEHYNKLSEYIRDIEENLESKKGFYLDFIGEDGLELKVDSLADKKSEICIANIKQKDGRTIATVSFPKLETLNKFKKKLQQYLEEFTKPNEQGVTSPKNNNLIANISLINKATLESFWNSDDDYLPKKDKKWCEVWIVKKEGGKKALLDICSNNNIEINSNNQEFSESEVFLVKANANDFNLLLDNSCDILQILEFRTQEKINYFFIKEMTPLVQSDWIDNLQKREIINAESKVVISLLDTGISKHKLLDHYVKYKTSYWGVEDKGTPNGHGTEMSGILIYDDLKDKLASNNKFTINHFLESVKIYSSDDEHKPNLYSYITKQSIAKIEINNPNALRVNCMAVTESTHNATTPSSWSASLDQLAIGVDDNYKPKRLLIVSVGNIYDDQDLVYLERNKKHLIENPSQAWNILSVGAMTEKINDNSIAPYGGISPTSRTSAMLEKVFVIKPEVVFEGGNLENVNGIVDNNYNLEELTTKKSTIGEGFFDTINATSCATAKASNMAAQIQYAYQDYWQETIRALMVHSAEWTEQAKIDFNIDEKPSKENYKNLLKTYGYGKPNLEKSLECSQSHLNFIIQEKIQPFKDKKMNEMHYFKLPFPKEYLKNLGNEKFAIKVTLSYFIEPSPEGRSWNYKHIYRSFGLRFKLKNPVEKEEGFIHKLSKSESRDNNSDNWLLGQISQNTGSIHSDIYKNTAINIAECDMVGIHPVGGWWKDNKAYTNNKARYSLIISLISEKEDIDIYTKTKNIIAGAKTEIKRETII